VIKVRVVVLITAVLLATPGHSFGRGPHTGFAPHPRFFHFGFFPHHTFNNRVFFRGFVGGPGVVVAVPYPACLPPYCPYYPPYPFVARPP
jgi:hypothetical protein